MWRSERLGLDQTDKKLIMNIDVKRMRRGHARDTFFVPHDTLEHPFCRDKVIRRETWACNDPVPKIQSTARPPINQTYYTECQPSLQKFSFRPNKHWSMSSRPHDPSQSQTEYQSPILKSNDAASKYWLCPHAIEPFKDISMSFKRSAHVKFSWHFKWCNPVMNVPSLMQGSA